MVNDVYSTLKKPPPRQPNQTKPKNQTQTKNHQKAKTQKAKPQSHKQPDADILTYWTICNEVSQAMQFSVIEALKGAGVVGVGSINI